MNFHRISEDDMLNGNGLRIVLWLAGCNHQCPECQNPETWDPHGGSLFTLRDSLQVLSDLGHDHIKGLTVSGGDPLFPENRSEVTLLCETVKRLYPQKDIWCYTGYHWDEVKDLPMMQYIDVLVDGPYQKELRDVQAHWVGSRNQRIIDVHRSIEQGSVVLYEEI